jgi:uncharacterized protein YbjT (DUF2867 family)
MRVFVTGGSGVIGRIAVPLLATRIPPAGSPPEAWRANDRLRAEATPLLVDAALAAGSEL